MENRYQDLFFQNFQEGKINFNPTYKFDVRTSKYDSSKKNRVPAYCDRILWKRHQKLTQTYYDSVCEVNFTDHKPVVAHFELQTKAIKNLHKSKSEILTDHITSEVAKVSYDISKEESKKPTTDAADQPFMFSSQNIKTIDPMHPEEESKSPVKQKNPSFDMAFNEFAGSMVSTT